MSNKSIRCIYNTMDSVKRINFSVVKNIFVLFIIKHSLLAAVLYFSPLQNLVFFTWDFFFISTFITTTHHLENFSQIIFLQLGGRRFKMFCWAFRYEKSIAVF